MNVSSIGEYIREQREQAKISLRQLAAAAGVSNPYLSQIERGLRRPSAEILQQIAKGLRISAEALYVQAGILEERPPDPGGRGWATAGRGGWSSRTTTTIRWRAKDRWRPATTRSPGGRDQPKREVCRY